MGQLSSLLSGTDQERADRLRQLARQEGDLMGQAFEQSKLAYQRSDHAAAKSLSEKGKTHKKNMENYNSQAADTIFSYLNKNRPLDELDLHGLFVKEAMQKFEERVKECRKKRMKRLTVIVGQGNHSVDGIAKIKPAMVDMAQRLQMQYEIDPKNPGCIVVYLVDHPVTLGSIFRSAVSQCSLM